MIVNQDTLDRIHAHAAKCNPRECCGLIILFKGRLQYKPCTNIAIEASHFIIDPEDWADAEDKGTILMIVHSHVFETPKPSQPDLVSCERSGIPWMIVNYPTKEIVQFEPTGYKAPLEGRSFSHGILDCYSLIRDYYKSIDITIPDFKREQEWWKKNQNLYLENFEKAGFIRVSDLKINDVLLMLVDSLIPNHAAIFVDDNIILHHLQGRLSSRDVYGGWYRKITTHIVRHKSFL